MLQRRKPASLRRIAALAIAFLASPLLHAQQQHTPPLAGVAHIAIRVRSLEASREFYEKLGFEEAFDLKDKDGKPRESFIKINDHQFLELYPANPEIPKEASIGFLHVCFEGDDLQAIHDDYVAHGLTPTPVRKAGAGNLLFTVAGPIDANGTAQNLEYTQYQPGSLHSNDQGKHVGQDRIADSIGSVAIAMKDPTAARDFYLNQLSFKSIAGDPMFLHMPGNSGQEIEIANIALGSKARFILRSENLSKAARILHKQNISVLKSKDTLTVSDPDGNIIMIRSL
ncbi:VOC family protein [Edaphobacter modestus]|uniref:Catechol 2,3-dioxygenase-like lactoylglutathione lyase family enzyme n=1 Tax=Edaphobacter modestus TaxID=388466 RepID=A0A4Q7YVD5_9BACT|nr:VOC family protein [Edaphobacter modestus]RZU41630.1 catechol 2,3-dioxygenase-like lactoylglutathione lyase family enzyme [Edaphobacter modestus]